MVNISPYKVYAVKFHGYDNTVEAAHFNGKKNKSDCRGRHGKW